MKRIYLFISILIIISCSCDKLFPDDKLSLQRTDYTGNDLRMNGYYYTYYNPNSTNVYFMYRNGIILRVSSFSTQNLDEIEKEMVSDYKYLYDTKSLWGIFVIDGVKIQYERWVSSTGSGLRAALSSGYIENDTTFHITETYFNSTGETRQGNEVYHFKQFSPKPDSTNVYIK